MKTDLHLNKIDPDIFSENILTLLNSNKPKDFLFADIVTLVQRETRIESIGLRLQEGFDYPYYVTRGFSRDFVEKTLAGGTSLLLDIDVQGADQIMASDLAPVTIFIMPPSFEELETRLRKRGTDSEAVIETRLKNARIEMEKKDRYRHVLVNDDLDEAIQALTDIFEKEIRG